VVNEIHVKKMVNIVYFYDSRLCNRLVTLVCKLELEVPHKLEKWRLNTGPSTYS